MGDEAKTNAVKCGGCGGDGDCRRCSGRGALAQEQCCIRCGGNGICPGCKGSGWIIVR